MVLGGNSSHLHATGRQMHAQQTTGRGFWGDLGHHISNGVDWIVDTGLGLLSPHLSNAYQNVKHDIKHGAHWSQVAGHVAEGVLHGGADVLSKVAGVHPGYLPISKVASGVSEAVKNPSLQKVSETIHHARQLPIFQPKPKKRPMHPSLEAYAKKHKILKYKQ